MSAIENKALSITPPVAGQNTIVRDSVTSAELIRLPWTSGYITIQADGVDAWVCFGPSTVVVSKTATTTLNGTTKAPSAHGAGESWKIPTDQALAWNLDEINLKNRDAEYIYLSHIASATTGYIRIQHSSGKVVLA